MSCRYVVELALAVALFSLSQCEMSDSSAILWTQALWAAPHIPFLAVCSEHQAAGRGISRALWPSVTLQSACKLRAFGLLYMPCGIVVCQPSLCTRSKKI
eukprot:scaffold170399_cov28-Tisochrysis_lutea.AAC.2